MQRDDLGVEAFRKTYITNKEEHENDAGANLRSGHVNQDVSESELNVHLLFPCLPSEG